MKHTVNQALALKIWETRMGCALNFSTRLKHRNRNFLKNCIEKKIFFFLLYFKSCEELFPLRYAYKNVFFSRKFYDLLLLK